MAVSEALSAGTGKTWEPTRVQLVAACTHRLPAIEGALPPSFHLGMGQTAQECCTPRACHQPVLDPHQAPHQAAPWINDWECAWMSPIQFTSSNGCFEVGRSKAWDSQQCEMATAWAGGERQSSSADAPCMLSSGCPIPWQ